MERYIVIDTETSGTDFCSSQVIQCGIITLNKDLEVISEKEWNVNYKEKDFSWSEESAEIHKIPKEVAKTHGLEPEEFLNLFEKEIIRSYSKDSFTPPHIIAANAYFDYLMLLNLWKKYRGEENFPFSYRMCDLNSIGLFLFGLGSFGELCDYFEIQRDEEKMHSALYDAKLHLMVYKKLLDKKDKIDSI